MIVWQDRINKARKAGGFTFEDFELASRFDTSPPAEKYGLAKGTKLADMSCLGFNVFQYGNDFFMAVNSNLIDMAQMSHDKIMQSNNDIPPKNDWVKDSVQHYKSLISSKPHINNKGIDLYGSYDMEASQKVCNYCRKKGADPAYDAHHECDRERRRRMKNITCIRCGQKNNFMYSWICKSCTDSSPYMEYPPAEEPNQNRPITSWPVRIRHAEKLGRFPSEDVQCANRYFGVSRTKTFNLQKGTWHKTTKNDDPIIQTCDEFFKAIQNHQFGKSMTCYNKIRHDPDVPKNYLDEILHLYRTVDPLIDQRPIKKSIRRCDKCANELRRKEIDICETCIEKQSESNSYKPTLRYCCVCIKPVKIDRAVGMNKNYHQTCYQNIRPAQDVDSAYWGTK